MCALKMRQSPGAGAVPSELLKHGVEEIKMSVIIPAYSIPFSLFPAHSNIILYHTIAITTMSTVCAGKGCGLKTVLIMDIRDHTLAVLNCKHNYPSLSLSLCLSLFSLPLFPFVRGEVLPATFSSPHLIVFSTLLCLLSSASSVPPLLPSSHLS